MGDLKMISTVGQSKGTTQRKSEMKMEMPTATVMQIAKKARKENEKVV